MKLIDLKKEMMKLKRTDKNKANVLMMLIDTVEKMAKEKNPKKPEPDLFIVDGLKRYIKQVEDAKKNGMDVENELNYLKELGEDILPKTLNESQLMHIIVEFKNDNPDAKMGQIMGYLKKNFGDEVDMKMASKLVKEVLS